MKIAIQIDHINSLNIHSDSSLFIAYGMQELGHHIFYYHPSTMFCANEQIYAQIKPLTLKYQDKQFLCDTRIIHTTDNLNQFDAILIRQNPPFDMSYTTTCHMLSRLKCPVLNKPLSVIGNPEKLSVLNFREYIPATIITGTINSEAIDFFEKYNHVVAKPLYGFGGEDVVLLKNDEDWQPKLNIMLHKYGYIVLQRFLKNVINNGDKRIFMLNGNIVGAFQRKPAKGSIKSNLAAGGSAASTILTIREQEICTILSPWLRQQGLFFAGIDLIDEHLIEINITSPTGLLTLHQFGELSFESVALELQTYIESFKN